MRPAQISANRLRRCTFPATRDVWYGDAMTLIDKFVAFAKALPADRRAPVEEALGSIMATLADDTAFTTNDLTELDRRLAEPKVEYLSGEEITELLGKPFA